MPKTNKNQSAAEHNWRTLKQHYHHYKALDFCYWERRANYTTRRIESLKKEKSKHPYYLELYTDYIQLFEVVAINIRAMLSPQLFECLFIRSEKLREKIAELFPDFLAKENPGVDKWVRGLVFHHAVFGKYVVNNAEQKIRKYKTMLKESAQDYLKDYQLLNAFKHGFRTQVSGESTLAISLDDPGKASSPHVVGQYSSSITYYSLNSVEVDEKRIKVVFKNKISFNYQRVYQKILYLSNSLENARQAILYVAKPEGIGKQKLCTTLKVTDREAFQKHYGVWRWREPVHQLLDSNMQPEVEQAPNPNS